MGLRLAELLASLSLVTDLGMGYRPEQALESCLIACELARTLQVSRDELADVYYTALLLHVGCTAYAHEQALLVSGDDIRFRGVGSRFDFGSPREGLSGVFQIVQVGSPAARARSLVVMLARGSAIDSETSRATCEVATQMARRIGLPVSIQLALYQMFERWDGKGHPRSLTADDHALPMRITQVAAQAALFNRLGGPELACAVIRKRAAGALDPSVAHAFVQRGSGILDEISAVEVWQAVLDAEPKPQRLVSDPQLDEIAHAFADAVDLKSPYFHGHSVQVAQLAEAAARSLGLDEGSLTTLRRAALFHDLGRVGVPNGIWEKPGALTRSEWEQVRLHPYHSERILACAPTLAEVAALAGLHHERQDGSGYYRQLTAVALPLPARILAAADAFQSMTQLRPHRPALTMEAAARQLAAEVASGRLDADAVHAVQAVAGQRPAPVRSSLPSGLTARELEVLRLITQGCSNREMARRLSISPKTVDHHIQHIYDKIGVSTRASATMFAMEHDLLRP